MTEVKSTPIVRFALLDTALVTMACLIPAASHLFAVPLYAVNPMLALLLAGILFGKDWRNALLLAVLMPLVSCLLTGMPAAGKMVCMVAELATVATMFGWLSRKWNVLPAVLVSVCHESRCLGPGRAGRHRMVDAAGSRPAVGWTVRDAV